MFATSSPTLSSSSSLSSSRSSSSRKTNNSITYTKKTKKISSSSSSRKQKQRYVKVVFAEAAESSNDSNNNEEKQCTGGSCDSCGVAREKMQCDGTGRIQGGLAAIPLFSCGLLKRTGHVQASSKAEGRTRGKDKTWIPFYGARTGEIRHCLLYTSPSPRDRG